MPESSRFGGMVIYMLFHDTGHIISHMSMFTMVILKQPLGLMASC